MIILALPALAALAYAVVAALVGEGPLVWWVACELSQVATVIACAAAAASFRRGEHMWLAWAATGAGYAAAVVSNAAHGPTLAPAVTAAFLGYEVAMNAGVVSGALLFVFAWSRAGLALSGGRRVGAATVTAAVALALALNWSALGDALRQAASGPRVLEGYDETLSIVADVIAFGASVPLLRMAFALRGSRLAPVWMLLGASNLSWVVYDRLYALLAGAPSWRLAVHAAAIGATACIGSAAWAHQRAVRGAAALEARAA